MRKEFLKIKSEIDEYVKSKRHRPNKAKGQISKRWIQENEARQIFRKTNISQRYVCVSAVKKCSFSGKFGVPVTYPEVFWEYRFQQGNSGQDPKRT